MRRTLLAQIFPLLLFALSSAQQPAPSQESEQAAANQEAGAYERKSVSYIDALWLMDKSVRGMPGEYVKVILDDAKEHLLMERFDRNPLPQALIRSFVDQANQLDFPTLERKSGEDYGSALAGFRPQAGQDPMLDSITAIMDRTLVPKILEIVDAQKSLRAQGLLTQQQQNSFVTDKAKELGITAVELQKVMNSAFVFIPLARAFGAVERKETGVYTIKMDVGIIWWRIDATGEKAKAVPVVKKFSLSIGEGVKGKSYMTTQGPVDYKEFAFRSLVKNAVRNLVVATQEIPEFRLSAQVLEKKLGAVTFEVGRKEGVRVDDRYRIVKAVEGPGGAVTKVNKGWVAVTRVGKGEGRNARTKAKIISGSPSIGTELSEYPRLPLDILVKFKMFPYVQVSEGDTVNATDYWIENLKLSGGVGFQADAAYNIGRFMHIPQLFFDFGFGMGFGSAKGQVKFPGIPELELKAVSNMSFDFSLVKKFRIRRVALVAQPIFGLQNVSITTVKAMGDTLYSLANNVMGFAANGGVEIALAPSLNLHATAGYQLYGKNDRWDFMRKAGGNAKWESLRNAREVPIDHSGLRIQAGLCWSPPALPFDPWDLLRSRVGI